jgi:hypothetical protein
MLNTRPPKPSLVTFTPPTSLSHLSFNPNLFRRTSGRHLEIFRTENRSIIYSGALDTKGSWGGVLVKVLRYYSDGPGIDSPWFHRIFHWHISFRQYRWPWGRLRPLWKWVPGTFPGGKGGWCVRVTTSQPSCAECHENLGVLTSCYPLRHTGPVTGILYLYLCWKQKYFHVVL